VDIEQFTERVRGVVQAAGTIAIREIHQRITPQHMLKAMLDDGQGRPPDWSTRRGRP
jgi:ATP-dependent Clp protease ATP-binding subunit ClpB